MFAIYDPLEAARCSMCLAITRVWYWIYIMKEFRYLCAAFKHRSSIIALEVEKALFYLWQICANIVIS